MNLIRYFCLTAACGMLACAASATTWDLAADFSANTNPHGAWTYGYLDGGGSFVTQTQNYNNGWAWWGDSAYQTPNIGMNLWNYTAYGIQAGHVSLESDWYTPAVQWTAPDAGAYDIRIVIGGTTDWGGGGTGNKNAYSALMSLGGVLVNGSYDAKTNLTTWDLHHQVLSAGEVMQTWIPQNYLSGNTDTSITINGPVPEPITLLLGAGCLALAFRRRRR